jgi:hypothetical protein
MSLPHPLGPYPFSRAQMLDAGVTADQFRVAAETGRIHRIRRGVYVLERAADDRTRFAQNVAAILITRKGHFAVGDSAAAFHEFPNPWFMPWTSRATTIAGPKSRPDRRIRGDRTSRPVETPWGLAQDPVGAAMEVASTLTLPQALIVTDHVARRLAGTTNRFELASARCRDRVREALGAVSDVPAARLADPAAESPAESFCRGHLILRGFDEPRCGVPLRGHSGAQYFIDILLGDLAIEVDGRGKYEQGNGVDVLLAEKRREDDLRAGGVRFHRILVDDLYARPDLEMDRVRSRL